MTDRLVIGTRQEFNMPVWNPGDSRDLPTANPADYPPNAVPLPPTCVQQPPWTDWADVEIPMRERLLYPLSRVACRFSFHTLACRGRTDHDPNQGRWTSKW